MKTFPSGVKLLLICYSDLVLPAVLLVLGDEAESVEEGVRGGLLLLPAPRPAALYRDNMVSPNCAWWKHSVIHRLFHLLVFYKSSDDACEPEMGLKS